MKFLSQKVFLLAKEELEEIKIISLKKLYQKCRVRVASYAKVATAAEYPAPEPKKVEWDKPIPYTSKIVQALSKNRITKATRGPQFVFQRVGSNGSALIVVLWTVMVLAFAVVIASERIALILGDTSVRSKRVQAEFLADSAIFSLEVILSDEKQKLQTSKSITDKGMRSLELDRFQGPWHSEPKELNGGLYWIELVDEQSKINWLKTSPHVWRNLFESAELTMEASNAWFDCLTDWQDSDEARGLNGAETADYQSLQENRRRAKNAPVKDLGELFWIKGGFELKSLKIPVDSEGKKKSLLPMTTIYGDGKININTAPAALIAAALNLTIEGGEQVVKARWGPDLTEGTPDDVFLESVPQGIISNPNQKKNNSTGNQNPQDVSTAITTKATLFRVRGIGEFEGQRVIREALAVADGESGLRLLQEPRTTESVARLRLQ